MQDNIFNENVDYLYQVQTDLEAVEDLKKELAGNKAKEKSLKKAIASEEKSIKDEIAQTIKKRKNQLEKAYDEKIDATKSKSKNVQAKRDKTKSKKVEKRVEYETADITEENRQLQLEMKTLFKTKHVPSFCRSNFFYSMFMAKGAGEVANFIMHLIVIYLGIPMLMYLLSYYVFFVGNEKIKLLCSVTTGVTFVVLCVVYVILLNALKIKHYKVLLEGRDIREQIKANKKQIKAISNKINKDKDESGYGLDKYDDKLSELDDELEQISREKQEAMTQFERETKQVLTDEVNDRRLGKLEELNDEVEEIEKHIAALEQDIQDSTVAIANNYGAILGKEFCTPTRVADLISLMEDGTADTVSEAIAAYKGTGR